MKFKKILSTLMSAIFITAFFTQPNVNAAAIKGDANGNGVIDLQDVILIAKFLIKPNTLTLEQQEAADYNGDNKVNLKDVIGIAKCLIKKSPSVTTSAKVTTKTTITTVKKTTVTTIKNTIGLVTVDVSNAKYILNTSTKKFHIPNCTSASKIAAANKAGANDRAAIINAGYSPCKKCNP